MGESRKARARKREPTVQAPALCRTPLGVESGGGPQDTDLLPVLGMTRPMRRNANCQDHELLCKNSKARSGTDHNRARRIAGTSMMRRCLGGGGFSTALTVAVTNCSIVTNPKRSAVARVAGIISASRYSGMIAFGHRWPGPRTYQGRKILAVSSASRIMVSPRERTQR